MIHSHFVLYLPMYNPARPERQFPQDSCGKGYESLAEKNCMSLGHAFSDKQSSIAFRRRTSSPMASRNHGGVASPQGFVVVSRDTVRGDVQHIRMPANSAASAPCLNGREKIHRCALRISLTCWCVRRQSCATSPWCVRRQSCANSP